MKTICTGAKRQLSNCMQEGDYVSHRSSFIGNNHNLRERTTSMYDSLERPFKPDSQRGRWASSIDFFFTCTSHAFGTAIFSEVPVYALLFGGVYLIPAYLVGIILYAIPVFVVQSFLGQFSSSGTISALRVAPLFKGIGYSIVLLNLVSLSYYAVIAAVPLVYATNSLHIVIPWMSCNNAWNSENCSTHSHYDEEDELQMPHATVEFFRAVIRSSHDSSSSWSLSWPILCGVLGVWLTTMGLLLKRVPFIGKVIRCSSLVLLTFFVATFAHLVIHSGLSWSTLIGYLEPTLGASFNSLASSMRASIYMATWMLGSGWGSVLTLASYNSFRRDSEKLTYWVSLMHVILAIMAIICGRIALDHFEDEVGMFHYHVEEHHYMQFVYLCLAYLFGSFTSLPNFWSFIFFTMLFIAELSAVVVQMMTVLTALFDEFESLRKYKGRITIAICLAMLATSIYFCTQQGFEKLNLLPLIGLLSHVTISIVLLLMTTWIYGRDRFQCDLQFMLGKTISNFKIFLLRFITPILLLICSFQVLFLLDRDTPLSEFIIVMYSLIYFVAPVYAVYKLCQTRGTFRNRLNQCFAPHDWHPVDADNRSFYEEVMGLSEMMVLHNEQCDNVP